MKILIAGPSWIGDMVMTHSLVSCLSQKYPGAIIDITAPAWALAVAMRMKEVTNVYPLASRHGRFSFKPRLELGRRLKKIGFDRAVIIPRSYKSALVPFFAKIPVRIGFRGEMRRGLINNIVPVTEELDQTIKKILALGGFFTGPASKIPYPKLEVDEANRNKLAAKLGIQSNDKIVGIMPGAEYGHAKRWPLEFFREIARLTIKNSYRVLIIGGEKDIEAGNEISRSSDKIINLCGKTSVFDAIDLLSLCNKVVCNDSGLMHVACAVGTEVHVIYGSSSPLYTPPLTGKKHIYTAGLECSPCFKRTCRFGHFNCLRRVTPQVVSSRLKLG